MVSRVSSEQRQRFSSQEQPWQNLWNAESVNLPETLSFSEYLSSVSSFGSVSDDVLQVLSDGASGSGPESPLSVVSPIKRSGFSLLSADKEEAYNCLYVTGLEISQKVYLLSEAIPSLRDSLIYLVLEAESFIQHKLKYHALESISSAWKLFRGGTTETRQECERQLTGAVVIVFSVIQWTITSVYFALPDLGVKSNSSASVLLLPFSIATLFLFKKYKDATDSSHGVYNNSSRNSSVSHIPAVDHVPSTANHFLLLIIRTPMNQFNLLNDLLLVSSPASLMAPATRQVNQQYQWQTIKQVCQLLCKYKKRSLAVFYLVLEEASIFLSIWKKSRGATRIHSLRQLVETVEVAFSVIRVSVTLIYSILVVLHVRNNFSAPVLPPVFSVIVAVFTFKYDGEVSDSSGHADDDLYGDLPVKNIPLIQALPRASNELFPTGMMVASSNPVPLQWHQPLIINSICFRQVYTFHKGRRKLNRTEILKAN
ncbi:hypothetical protein WN944_005802 [Citrus x changshan-huyou]|uniref:Uncharacterized protein n=1 Tax=Citrus x changshan-huyou TaxID=2935761 RepID=A0AAP0MKL9_9ROSI